MRTDPIDVRRNVINTEIITEMKILSHTRALQATEERADIQLQRSIDIDAQYKRDTKAWKGAHTHTAISYYQSMGNYITRNLSKEIISENQRAFSPINNLFCLLICEKSNGCRFQAFRYTYRLFLSFEFWYFLGVLSPGRCNSRRATEPAEHRIVEIFVPIYWIFGTSVFCFGLDLTWFII